jgi:hypothetical protein
MWHGSSFPLRFANVEIEMTASAARCRWSAIVGFSSAPLRYPLFGMAGGLEYFDATFRGEDEMLELSPNGRFPGSTTLAP